MTPQAPVRRALSFTTRVSSGRSETRTFVPAGFPYGQNGCEVQLIQADPMTGHWIVKLRGPAGGNLGVHRHYGSVLAFTLRGAWRYLEQDWISRTGDIVHETPGSVHTLLLEDDSEVIFFVEGHLSIWIAKHVLWRMKIGGPLLKNTWFCTERGLEIVDVARPRPASHGRVAVA